MNKIQYFLLKVLLNSDFWGTIAQYNFFKLWLNPIFSFYMLSRALHSPTIFFFHVYKAAEKTVMNNFFEKPWHIYYKQRTRKALEHDFIHLGKKTKAALLCRAAVLQNPISCCISQSFSVTLKAYQKRP